MISGQEMDQVYSFSPTVDVSGPRAYPSLSPSQHQIPPSQHQHCFNLHLNQQNTNTPLSSTSLSQTTPKSRRDDLPVKLVKSSQSLSSRAPKPQRKHNLKDISDNYNRFHALDEMYRTNDPDSDLEPSNHSPT